MPSLSLHLPMLLTAKPSRCAPKAQTAIRPFSKTAAKMASVSSGMNSTPSSKSRPAKHPTIATMDRSASKDSVKVKRLLSLTPHLIRASSSTTGNTPWTTLIRESSSSLGVSHTRTAREGIHANLPPAYLILTTQFSQLLFLLKAKNAPKIHSVIAAKSV